MKKRVWLNGESMLRFIEYNDGEAMYFTPDMDTFQPKKEFMYLVGLDDLGKNTLVFDKKKK